MFSYLFVFGCISNKTPTTRLTGDAHDIVHVLFAWCDSSDSSDTRRNSNLSDYIIHVCKVDAGLSIRCPRKMVCVFFHLSRASSLTSHRNKWNFFSTRKCVLVLRMEYLYEFCLVLFSFLKKKQVISISFLNSFTIVRRIHYCIGWLVGWLVNHCLTVVS